MSYAIELTIHFELSLNAPQMCESIVQTTSAFFTPFETMVARFVASHILELVSCKSCR